MALVDDRAIARRSRGPRLAILGVFAITAFTIFGGEFLLAPDADDNRAPPIGVRDLDGEVLDVSAGGLPSVVVFSKVSCPACEVSLGDVEQASRRWKDKVNFFALAPDEATEVKATADRLGLTFPVGSDPGGNVATRYGADPAKATTFVFVSATGRILDREPGPLRAETLERRIRGLISAGPKPS